MRKLDWHAGTPALEALDHLAVYEFLLDYEEDEDDEDGSSRRKKPWRYRWPDDVRDEGLARLLELNNFVVTGWATYMWSQR